MDWSYDPRTVLIRLQLPDGVLDVEAPRKRLATGTIFLFVGWLVGSALLLFSIAALFMRNQVRAIRRLARAAEAFGMGRDTRRSGRRARRKCVRRRRRSIACRSASAASWCSGPKCWPASRTTCARP